MTTALAKSAQIHWRDVLPVHPAADLFPMMADAELRDLGEDIKRNGMLVPITIQEGEDGIERLLDGRNRLDAMEMAGMPVLEQGELHPITVKVKTIQSVIDAYACVVSANIRRRHLTPKQKAALIVTLLKKQPEKS